MNPTPPREAAQEDAQALGFWRRVMCRLHLCAGVVEHERDKEGVWWVGLHCATCDKLLCPIKSQFQDKIKS